MKGLPTRVIIVLGEGAVPDGTTMTLTAADGSRVDRGDGGLDRSDTTGKMLQASLRPSWTGGRLTIHWTAVLARTGVRYADEISFTATPWQPSPATVASGASTAGAAPAVLPRAGGLPHLAIAYAGLLGSALILAGCALLVAASQLRIDGWPFHGRARSRLIIPDRSQPLADHDRARHSADEADGHPEESP